MIRSAVETEQCIYFGDVSEVPQISWYILNGKLVYDSAFAICLFKIPGEARHINGQDISCDTNDCPLYSTIH